MLISFVSLQGSPGVSAATLALTWVWPSHAIAAECDPTGGRALAVFDPDGTHGRRGIFELLLAARKTSLHRAMSAQMLTLPNGTAMHHLLPGAGSIREAESLRWLELAALFDDLKTVDVLADCGRLRARGTPRAVLEAADLTVLMVRNDRHSLRTAASSLDLVRAEAGAIGVGGLVIVVVNHDGHSAQRFPLAEIRREFAALGVPVAGVLPWDPVAAARFTQSYWPHPGFETMPLISSSRHLAGEIGRLAEERARRLERSGQVQLVPDQPSTGRGQLHLVSPHQPAPVPRRDLGKGALDVP